MKQNSSNDNDKKLSLKKIKATFDSNGNIKSNKNKGNFWPKLFSVIAALFLWLYVFQAVEYESVVKGVPILIENFNTNLGLDIVSGFESTVDVTLSGTKSTINEISSDSIKASVDLSDITKIGTYILDIELEAPGTAKIVNKSISQVKITVDKTAEKQIEITPMINYNIQYPYELGEPVLSENSVTLVGPETDILSVAKANVELNVGNVKNNVVANSNITLYDSKDYSIDSKYIIIEPSIIRVEIPVIKTDRFDIDPDIIIDSEKYDYRIEPKRVYIKGGVNEVESLVSVKTERMQINEAGEYELLLLLSENMSAYTEYTTKVENMVSSVKLIVTEKIAIPEEEKVSNDK